jgi:hypothetical protein
MKSWKAALTDQSTADAPLATPQQIADALQQQADNNLAPNLWGAKSLPGL